MLYGGDCATWSKVWLETRGAGGPQQVYEAGARAYRRYEGQHSSAFLNVASLDIRRILCCSDHVKFNSTKSKIINKKLTSLRPSRRPSDLDCRSGKNALSASMRDERSSRSALVAAVRSAQESLALRRLSSRCLARERRGAGASSSGSLHTSRAACTVCRRRDTGGDVSRDTSDSNISGIHYQLCRDRLSIKSISPDYPATSNAYEQTIFYDDCSRSRLRGDSMASAHAITDALRCGQFGSLTELRCYCHRCRSPNSFVCDSFTQRAYRDGRKWQNAYICDTSTMMSKKFNISRNYKFVLM